MIKNSRSIGVVTGMVFLLFAVPAFAQWKPPIGIPEPAFGIHQAHTMFEGKTFNFGSGPEPYRAGANGPYTHYVDNTSPLAIDSGNPYGTPQKPRLTFPGNLPPGSVVELHGGPYNFRNLSDKMAVWGQGTAIAPIFVRGASASTRPVLAKDLMVLGSYVVVENLIFDKARIAIRQDLLSQDIHHIALRGLEMRGTGAETGNGEAISVGLWGVTSAFSISDVVVYGNNLHDFGDRSPSVEADWLGVSVSGYDCFRTWIVDNDMYRFGGDSVRVGNNAGWSVPYSSSYAYIGRNRMHDNGENALDVKLMSDVVASQNVMFNFAASASDPGTAVVVHYNPANVWLLFNEIYNAPGGVISSGVGDLYLIGNVIRDVSQAVKFWGSGEIHIIGNTITRVDSAIYNNGGVGTGKPIVNNIIAELNNPASGYHIRYDLTTLASNSEMHHNLVFQSGGNVRIQWGSTLYTSLSAFQASTGKGADSLQADPQFVNALHGDFRLASGSPAVDRGTIISYSEIFYARFGQRIDLDFQGTRRPVGSLPDMGAFEFGGSGLLGTPQNVRIVPPDL